MGVGKRQAEVRAMRGKMWSPGRPPVGRREHRERFWEGIAGGLSSEHAGVLAGVSPAVGSRWFRESGGMAPFVFVSVSGRYLSFVEREEIALLHARNCGVREIARQLGRSPSTISRELRRNAATRSGSLEYRATTAQWAFGPALQPSEGLQAGFQRRASPVRPGSPWGHDHPPRWRGGARTPGEVEGASSRAPC